MSNFESVFNFVLTRSLKQDHTLTGFDKLKNPKRKAQYFSLFLFSRSTGLCHNEMQIFASRESTKRNTSNSFSQNQICFSTRSKYVPPREANLCFSWMQKKSNAKILVFSFLCASHRSKYVPPGKKSRKKRDHNFFHFRGCFLCMKNCASARIKYVLLVEAKNYHNFLFPFSRSTRQSKSVSPREGNLCFSWRHI